MPLYALGDAEPDIHPDAYVQRDGRIGVGARSSVQDGSVVHCTPWQQAVIGAEVTVGQATDYGVQSYVQRGKLFRAELRRIS